MNILYLCYALLILSLSFGLIRLMKGPTTLDRVLAFDTVAVSTIGMVIIFSIQQQTPYFLEIILIFCLLGFVTTVAFIDYFFRTLDRKSSNELE